MGLHVQPIENRSDWGGQIAVGATTLVVSMILKCTPARLVEKLPVDRFAPDEDGGLRKDSMAGKIVGGYSSFANVHVDADAFVKKDSNPYPAGAQSIGDLDDLED